MNGVDAHVLDVTQEIHDRIDQVRDRDLATRAGYGGEAHFRCQQLRKRDLTADQHAEVLAVQRRIYVECLGVAEGRVQTLLDRMAS